ncbi:MAG TPA: Lrp/AsnC family transcriptional regulator [Mycobacteriales bacterium]|jgi:Lrp/AsnC family leucine-responsive transcriptional regulator|nr:Lrp/AsnC family transcriptional regulator [Mycobacteriales bacterium]
MDDTDRRIVTALRADARATWAELGRAVGLSAPSVAERVARLERAGVVTGYHAAVDAAAVGLGVTALVGIYQREGTDQDSLVEALRPLQAIEDCWFVAGEEALIVKVRVPDVDGLERALGELRRTRGVARTRTTVVLSSRWEGRFPLADPGAPPS